MAMTATATFRTTQEFKIHAGSSCAEGTGGHIGKAEAAGVGGDSGIQSIRHFPVQNHSHLGGDLVEDLAAGGGAGIYQAGLPEILAGAVVIDLQSDPIRQALTSRLEHIGCRHIHGDQHIPLLHLLFGIGAVQMGIFFRHIRVFQHEGGLSQLPQAQT